jgi:O-antigen ligase
LLWLVPLVLFVWAILLTRSRGGFISLVAAVLVLSIVYFGWRKTLLVAVGLAPVVFALGIRQTDLALGHGTGQERIRIWSEGLRLLGQSPFFGIGYGNYAPEVGHVAHNSFLQCYTELGLLGGTFFLGAFFYALWMLWRLRPSRARIADPELNRLHPVLSALVFAYAIGMLSLSRSYVVPTYMVLGLAAVYVRAASVGAPAPALRLNARVSAILVAAGAVFIVTTYVFVRLLVHWG